MAAGKKLIASLKSTLKWSAGKRINGFRHNTAELILRINPDDRQARTVLRYKRKGKGKDARWVQKDDYKRPVDFAKSRLEEANGRVETACATFRDTVFRAMADHLEEGSLRYDRALDALAYALPDDEEVRTRRGDVKHDGRWMMPDTKTAVIYRAALHESLVAYRRSMHSRVKPHPAGKKARWKAAWTTGPRSVLGSIDAIEARKVLVNLEVANELCDRILGKSKTGLAPATVRLLKSSYEARRFLEENPAIAGSALAELDRFYGHWLRDRSYLSYREGFDEMRRAVIRQLVNRGLVARLGSHSRGWITEGVGQRLCYYVERDHGVAFMSFKRTEQYQAAEGEDVLPSAPHAWNRAAAEILKRDGHERLAAILTKRLNAMQAADVLVSYGLASFLIETRPEDFLRFAEESIKRHDVDALVSDTLGADDVAMLARHLERWLSEN